MKVVKGAQIYWIWTGMDRSAETTELVVPCSQSTIEALRGLDWICLNRPPDEEREKGRGGTFDVGAPRGLMVGLMASRVFIRGLDENDRGMM